MIILLAFLERISISLGLLSGSLLVTLIEIVLLGRDCSYLDCSLRKIVLFGKWFSIKHSPPTRFPLLASDRALSAILSNPHSLPHSILQDNAAALPQSVILGQRASFVESILSQRFSEKLWRYDFQRSLPPESSQQAIASKLPFLWILIFLEFFSFFKDNSRSNSPFDALEICRGNSILVRQVQKF